MPQNVEVDAEAITVHFNANPHVCTKKLARSLC